MNLGKQEVIWGPIIFIELLVEPRMILRFCHSQTQSGLHDEDFGDEILGLVGNILPYRAVKVIKLSLLDVFLSSSSLAVATKSRGLD